MCVIQGLGYTFTVNQYQYPLNAVISNHRPKSSYKTYFHTDKIGVLWLLFIVNTESQIPHF